MTPVARGRLRASSRLTGEFKFESTKGLGVLCRFKQPRFIELLEPGVLDLQRVSMLVNL